MNKNSISKIKKMHEKIFNETYVINTVINITKHACNERENNAQYYGITDKAIRHAISNERNDYLNMMTLLADKIACVMGDLVSIEDEL